MRELLSKHIQQQTGCTPNQANRFAQKYIDAVAKEALKQSQYVSKTETIYFNQNTVYRESGRITVDGTTYNVFAVIQGGMTKEGKVLMASKERLLNIIKQGSKITGLSEVQLTREFLDILYASTDPEELLGKVEDELISSDNAGIDYVPIDMVSLNNFIRANKAIARSGLNDNYVSTLNRNLRIAQAILVLAERNNGVLPHVRNPISQDSRRVYYMGLNLQNAPKEVRHAALGDCHEYDLENSVVAWKYSLCKDINPNIKLTATLEYLDHKRAIRQRLSQELFGNTSLYSVGQVKAAITSLGFGALLSTHDKQAIRENIKSKALAEKFISDPWVIEFSNEQHIMNKLILDAMEANNIHINDNWKDQDGFYQGKGKTKRVDKKIIWYYYEQVEREVQDEIFQELENCEPLLRVHDCVYTKRPAKLAELRAKIKEYGSEMNIGHDEHHRYGYSDIEIDHKKFIQQEEQKAARANGKVYVKKTSKPKQYQYVSPEGTYTGVGCFGPTYDSDFDPCLESQM